MEQEKVIECSFSFFNRSQSAAPADVKDQVSRFVKFMAIPEEDISHQSAHTFADYKFGYSDTVFSWSLQVLAHEVAHAAQLKPHELSRVFRRGWGFRVKKVTIHGQMYEDVQTTQISEREAEVFAIESRLLEAAGFSYDWDKYVKLMTWLPDYSNVPDKGGSWDSRVKQRGEWSRGRIQHHYERWTVEAAIAAFHANWAKIKEAKE